VLPPVYLKRQSTDLPSLAVGQSRLIVARNGIYLERRGPMYTSCTRVGESDMALDEHRQYCHLTCSKMSAALHRLMLSFFLQAHGMHRGEAALVLLYHPQRRQYRWHCPPQTVDRHEHHDGWYVEDAVEFENPLQLPDGFQYLGDAHLHPAGAHPSTLDVHDDQDGLHIIVGNITDTPQYHIVFAIDGARFQLDPAHFFADPATLPGPRAPSVWLEQIRIRVHRLGE
jgi:hypothetical protein